MNHDLAVVGAGPTGLAIALVAARRGRRVRVLERSERVGGMAASIEVGGQRVDLGSHRLHPSAPPRVMSLLRDLLGDDLQVRERNGLVHLGGSWVRFPFRPADLARSVPPELAARLVTDLVRRRTGRASRPDPATYADVVVDGLGPTALTAFHGPMAAKLWGRPAEVLSPELARRRIAVRDRSTVVRRLALTSRSAGRTFLYPRLGYGQIVDRLAEAAVDAGAEIHLSTESDVVSDVHTVWTAPVTELAARHGGPAATVTHRGLVLVYLVAPLARWSPYDAHYVPDPDVAFARLSEPKNYRDGPDPIGTTVLCAELPATPGDELWQASDDRLGELVLDGIARCGLRPPPVATVASIRLPRVYPVLTADDPAARERVLAWADRLADVTVIGRQGLAVGDNLHHVLDMALAFGDRLGDGDAPDPVLWRRERRRFERFVVDD